MFFFSKEHSVEQVPDAGPTKLSDGSGSGNRPFAGKADSTSHDASSP